MPITITHIDFLECNDEILFSPRSKQIALQSGVSLSEVPLKLLVKQSLRADLEQLVRVHLLAV